MTSAVLADPATRQAAGQEGRLARWAVPLVPAAAALALALTYIGRPAFWLDESATVSATRRPVGEMLRLFHHLDLVHAFYYLGMKVWVEAFGTGETALRLPSALATAAAAAGVAVLGRRCAGPVAGLLAGLVYAGSIPVASFAHEARSYAMVAAVAVLATYLLIRGVHPAERHPWRWFAGYGAAILVLGLLHLDGALLVPAHGATLLIARAKARRTWLRWTVCGGLGGALLVPLALAAQTQSEQVAWLPRPSWPLVWQLVKFMAGCPDLVWPTLVAALIGAWAGARRRGAEPAEGSSEGEERADGCSIPLTVLTLPWLVVPPALLLVASVVGDPMFMFRYVLFSVPALSLLMGAGLARIAAVGRPWLGGLLLAAAVAVLAVPSVQPQTDLRRHDSKLDDMRTPAQILRRGAHKGDAIIYINGVARWDAAAYPDDFGRLHDIGLAEDPVRAGNFTGLDKLPWQLRGPLVHSDRVWLMRTRASTANPGPMVVKRLKMIEATGPWRIAGNWRFKGGRLTLYVRTGPYRSPSAHGTAGKPQRAIPKPRTTTPQRAVPKPRRTAPAKP
ncbi:glycosyltransferase family 39 protein [Actinomadura verrucosospora]|uniref:Integral membrane protein n=1 Tax=Actinomadura verrucosospora TaxID=46165 RepID=A0A7D3VVT1_ACTVE|nr:glycosyltransferase family 39 protein [Actinomadura verrucosospora]QKG24735.1 integral membrane protein [Actinomadura verrucosospora]